MSYRCSRGLKIGLQVEIRCCRIRGRRRNIFSIFRGPRVWAVGWMKGRLKRRRVRDFTEAVVSHYSYPAQAWSGTKAHWHGLIRCEEHGGVGIMKQPQSYPLRTNICSYERDLTLYKNREKLHGSAECQCHFSRGEDRRWVCVLFNTPVHLS